MRRLLACCALLLALGGTAQAQNPDTNATCEPAAYLTAGRSGRLSVDTQGRICGVFAVSPSATAGVGITPVVSAALESNHVIKNAAGNFYSGYITTGATAGWLLLANSTTAPTAGGAAIAPLACVIAPANQTTSISASPPMVFSTGITMVFSTSGCLTNTASATAFFSGLAK